MASGLEPKCPNEIGLLLTVNYKKEERTTMTESAAQALSILRDPSNFQWSIIPILVIVIYIYNVEIGRQNWSIVFAGLALWGMDWFNEIANSLIFHLTGYAPLWAAPGGRQAATCRIAVAPFTWASVATTPVLFIRVYPSWASAALTCHSRRARSTS
jgi:hypothetical protein